MYAGVVEFAFPPEHTDAVRRWYDEDVIPAAKRSGGLKGGILLVNRQNGQSLGIGFWQSQADADAYEASGTLQGLFQKLWEEGIAFTASPVRSEYTVEHADLDFTSLKWHTPP
jgi:hypothetical protein